MITCCKHARFSHVSRCMRKGSANEAKGNGKTNGNAGGSTQASSSKDSLETNAPKNPFANFEFGKVTLTDFVPNNFQKGHIRCLDSLFLSGWNPTPHERRYRGIIP